MKKEFIQQLFDYHHSAERLPNKKAICNFTNGILQLLFPQHSEQEFHSSLEIEVYFNNLQNELIGILARMKDKLEDEPDNIARLFMEKLPQIHKMLKEDAQAIAEGDPAAVNVNQVIRTYPGFLAIAYYRIGHAFCNLNVTLLPRVLTEYAHNRTGIDIHPRAKIGSHFCIDHGTGVVIGETSVVGNYVKIYQGVTLGALSVAKEMAKLKRHPTIEDHVVIYAGATILGGNTVVGSHSIIGGNVWLTDSVPPYSRVYHKPQIKVRTEDEPPDVINFSI
ncbi:MAG: serine O-acetyltransferase [Candidatus Cyclobacteriaceae bacterium M3_2C_046]